MHCLQDIILTRGTNSFAIVIAPITISIYRFSPLTMMVNDWHFSLFGIDFGSAKYRNQHDPGSNNGCFCCREWSYGWSLSITAIKILPKLAAENALPSLGDRFFSYKYPSCTLYGWSLSITAIKILPYWVIARQHDRPGQSGYFRHCHQRCRTRMCSSLGMMSTLFHSSWTSSLRFFGR